MNNTESVNLIENSNTQVENTVVEKPITMPKPYHRATRSMILKRGVEFDLSSHFPGRVTVDRVIVIGAKVCPKENYLPWFFLAPRETEKTHRTAFTTLCKIASTIISYVFSSSVFVNQGCGFNHQMGEFFNDSVDFDSELILPVFFIDNFDKDFDAAKKYFTSSDPAYWRNFYGGGKERRKLGETRKYAGTKGMCVSFSPNEICTHPYSFCGLTFYLNTRVDEGKFYLPTTSSVEPKLKYLFRSEYYRENTWVINFDRSVDLEMFNIYGFKAWVGIQDSKPADDMLGWSDEEYEEIASSFDHIWKDFHATYEIKWCADKLGNQFIRARKSGCLYQVLRLILSCLPPGMDINKFMHYIHGNIYTDLLSIDDMLQLDTCRGEAQQLIVDPNHEIIDPIQARYPNLDLNLVPPVDHLFDNMGRYLSIESMRCFQAFDEHNRVDILTQAYPRGFADVPERDQNLTVFLRFAHEFIDVVVRNGHYCWRTTRGFNFRNNGIFRRVGGVVDLARPRRQDVAAGQNPLFGEAQGDGEAEPVHVAPAHRHLKERDEMYHIEEDAVYEILNTQFQPASDGHKFTLSELRSLMDLEKLRGDIQGNEAGLILMVSNLLDKYNDGTLDNVYFSSAYLTCNAQVRKEIDNFIENIAKKYEKEVEKMKKNSAKQKSVVIGEQLRSNFGGDDRVFDDNVRNGIINVECKLTSQGVTVKSTDLCDDVRPVLARNTTSPDQEGIRVQSVLCEKFVYVKPWWIPQFLITFICFVFNISYKSFYFKYKDDSRMLYVNERLFWNTYKSAPSETLSGPDLYAEVVRIHETGKKFYYLDPETPSMSTDTLLLVLMQLGLYDGFFQGVQSQKIGLNTVLMDMVLKTPYFQPQCQNLHPPIAPSRLHLMLIVISFLALFLYVPPLSVCVYQLPLLLFQKIMKLVSDIVLPGIIQDQMIYLSVLYVILLVTSVVVILNLYNHVIFCHLMIGSTQLLTAMIVKISFERYTFITSLIILIVLTVINYPVLSHLLRMNPTHLTKFHERSILEVILLNVFMVLCLSLLKMLYSHCLVSLNTYLSENVLNTLSNSLKIQDPSFVKVISVLLKHTSNLGSWIQLNLLSIVTYLGILLITVVLICQMMPSLELVSNLYSVPIKFILVILVIISGANACQVRCSHLSQMDYPTLSSCVSSFHGWGATRSERSAKAMMGSIPSNYVMDMEKTCSVLNTLKNSHLMSNSVSENQLKLVLSVDSIMRYLPTVNSKIGLIQYLKSYGSTLMLDLMLKELVTYCSPNSYQCLQRLRRVQLSQGSASMDSWNSGEFTASTRSVWIENYVEGISIMVTYINKSMKELNIALMMNYVNQGDYMTLNLVDSASGVTFVSKEFAMISQKLNDLNIHKCLEFLQNNKDSLKITSRSFIPTMKEFMNSFMNETTISSTLSTATLLEFPLVLAHHTGVVYKDYATMLQQRAGLKTSERITKMVDSFGKDFDAVLLTMKDCYNGEDINNATLAECYYNKTRDYFKTQNSHVNPYTAFIFETSYVYYHLSQYVDKYSYFALFDPRFIYMVVGRVMPSVGRLVASLQWEREDFVKDITTVGKLAVEGSSEQVMSYIDQVGVTTFLYQYISLTFADFVTSNFYHGYFEKDYANRVVSMYYKSHGMFISVDFKISFDYNAFFGAWHVFSHAVSKVLYLPDSVNQKIHDIISVRDRLIDRYVF